MSAMKSWTLSQRIAGTGLAVLLLVGALSFVAGQALARLHDYAEQRLRDDAIPGIVNVGTMTANSLRSYTRALLAGSTSDPTQRDALIHESESICNTHVEAALKRYQTAITDNTDRANFAELNRRRQAFATVRTRYFDLLRAGDSAAATQHMHAQVEPAFAAYRDHLAAMLDWNQQVATEVADQSAREAQSAWNLVMLTALTTILTAGALGWLIIRSINRTLRDMTGTLDDASSQVAAAAHQVSASSQSLAEGSSEQAASLEETGSSLEELSSMTRRNADSAQHAKHLSTETRSAAETGHNDMTEMRAAMDAIKTSSSDIAKIIKTIDEIAFQTNILALNAAVEAARAGEAGAGFAVVADEVRALAQRSANSAKETAGKIEVAIQSGENGVRISEKVAQSFGIIVDKARRVDELVGEIATASSEQNQGIGQINSAVGQMDKVTQANAGNAEETAAAAEELNAQSAMLRETVGQLRQLVGGGRATPPVGSARPSPASAKPAAPAGKPSSRPATLAKPAPRQALATTRADAVTVTAAGHDDFFKDA